MFCITVLEDVEELRAGMDARRKEHHLGCAVATLHEFGNLRRRQVRLAPEFRRQESVKCLFVESFVEQEFADRPIFKPIGSLIREIVDYTEPGVQHLLRGVLNLKDMEICHADLGKFGTMQFYKLTANWCAWKLAAG